MRASGASAATASAGGGVTARDIMADWIIKHPGRAGADLVELVDAVDEAAQAFWAEEVTTLRAQLHQADEALALCRGGGRKK